MAIFAWSVLIFLLIRAGVVLLNLIQNPALPLQISDQQPFVSILIPARNEAETLPHVLQQLVKLDYPDLEIIVLNDFSDDETERIIQTWARRDKRIRYINGSPLPAGWLGKNWACHQLAEQAQGEYFLFIDADVAFIHDQILLNSLAAIQKDNLALLSIFPDQIMDTVGEKLVVPLMHYFLLSVLPLEWIFKMPIAVMAAANGQFMLFDGATYREKKWHQQVKNKIAEDILIMRKVKANSEKGRAFTANGLIKTRMYRGYREGIQGFGKNILAGFGNRIAALLVYLTLTVGTLALAWESIYVLEIGLLAILIIRIGTSKMANQSIMDNLFFHPFQIVNLLTISFLSIYKKISGNNQWKGRNVQLK